MLKIVKSKSGVLVAALVAGLGAGACGGGGSGDGNADTDDNTDGDPVDAAIGSVDATSDLADAAIASPDAAIVCDDGFADCTPEAGCETAIAAGDELNCGGCGITCDALETCAVDTCVVLDDAPAIAAVTTDRMSLVDGSLNVTFTEPVTLGAPPSVECLSGSNLVATATSADDTTWQLQLTTPLLPGDVCTFTWAAADVTDIDDNNAFADAMADDAVFTGRAIDFLQDFQGTAAIAGQLTRELPAGFTVENVDGRTPAANVDYVNKAWIVREDFAFDTADFVAMSTSWYAPVGQSNDWIFTNKLAVSQGCTLAWNAIAYDNAYQDGYEVRFCTTPTAAGCVGETPLFTIAAEQSTWTARTADMSGITDTTGYLAFRNNTNDKFLLVVDDITVTCP